METSITGINASHSAAHIPIGRFAPSPTGPLHFGSLVAALASYLNVKSKGGFWLVRIEDIDPPREQKGAAQHILAALAQFGLQHDGAVVWQSRRMDAYRAAVQQLISLGHAFPCFCTRSQLAGKPHQGRCSSKSRNQPSWRLLVPDIDIHFDDQICGAQSQNIGRDVGDFVLWRSDDLPSYQLACVVDDAASKISEIVRGADLLDATPRQIYLQQLLGYRTPTYAHVPLVLGADGQKLSKQNLAPALDADRVFGTLELAYEFLGQTRFNGADALRWLNGVCAAWQIAAVQARLMRKPTRQM